MDGEISLSTSVSLPLSSEMDRQSAEDAVGQTQALPTATPTEVLDSLVLDMSDVFGEGVARRGEGVSGDGEGVAGGEGKLSMLSEKVRVEGEDCLVSAGGGGPLPLVCPAHCPLPSAAAHGGDREEEKGH